MKSSKILLACAIAAIVALFAFRGLENSTNNIGAVSSDNPALTNEPWPQLLVRNDVLSKAPEWEATVAAVNQASSDLIEDPNDSKALIKLAKIYTNEARVTGEHGYYYPAILAMLDEALVSENITKNDLFEAYGLRANTLMSQHRFAEALIAAEYAVGLNPRVPSAYAALIDAHVEMGNYAAAVHNAQKLMDMRPDLVSYARASYLRELHGDIAGAIEAMEMAVTAGYPGRENTEWARITLAEMHVKYGNHAKAERLYRESLELRENYPFALAGLADLRLRQERFDEAEQLFNQAIAIIPEFGFQQGLLEVYRRTDRPEEARKAYDELLAMLDDDIAHGHIMNLEYADVLLEYGNAPVKALPYVMKEYEQRPGNVDVNFRLAKIYTAMGEHSKAKTHMTKAMETGIADPDFEFLSKTLAMN